MKINPEVLGQGLGVLFPLFALGLALLIAAVMCVVGLLLCLFSHSFQNEEGDARNRKSVVKVTVIAAIILAMLSALTFFGLNHQLMETLQIVSEIEAPSDS